MADLGQIDAATHRFVDTSGPKLVDAVGQHDPFVAYLKANCAVPFTGGRQIVENFQYDGLIGGAYLKRKEFDITERQIEQQLAFTPKYFEVGVTLSQEDVEVENTGPAQIFSLIQGRMEAAYRTIGQHLSIGVWLNGQRAGYEANVNGLAEAINDGTTTNWDGAAYTTYGGITRGGSVGNTISSVPTNINGSIQLTNLEDTNAAASLGSGDYEANVGVTTVKGYSYVKNKFQTQQRFVNVTDAKINFQGLQFNGCTLMKSRYVPGSYLSGTGDPIAVTFLKQTSNNAITAYPTMTSETLWWLNCRKPFMKFYVSTNPKYAFGWTGFKPGQGNTVGAGQVLWGGGVVAHPRFHQQLYGITG